MASIRYLFFFYFARHRFKISPRVHRKSLYILQLYITSGVISIVPETQFRPFNVPFTAPFFLGTHADGMMGNPRGLTSSLVNLASICVLRLSSVVATVGSYDGVTVGRPGKISTRVLP